MRVARLAEDRALPRVVTPASEGLDWEAVFQTSDLEEQFDEEDLPANTYYGDGTRIEPEVLDALREAYEAETVRFPWRLGDLLVLDNMLAAHGRASFSGPRQILVSMSEPCGWEALGG